jgi:hypothetical protein
MPGLPDGIGAGPDDRECPIQAGARLPPADFTARVLAALPAARTAREGFWPRMLVPMAYAVSILALLLGLRQSLRDPSGVAGVWSDPVSMHPGILDMGWLVPSVAPSRLEGFFRTAVGVADDALASVTAMGEPLRGLYSANAPVIYLTLAALALLWVLYDDRQEAKE